MAFAPGQICRVLYEFTAEESTELSTKAGELVVVADATSAAAEGWVLVHRQRDASTRGFVPSDYIAAVAPAAASSPAVPTPLAFAASSGAPSSTAAAAAYPASSLSFEAAAGYAGSSHAASSTRGPGSLTAHAIEQNQLASAYLSPQRSAGGSPAAAAALVPYGGGHGSGGAASSAASGAAGFPLGSGGGSGTLSSSLGGGRESGGAALPLSTLPPEYAQLFSHHEDWFRAATAKRADAYRHLQGEAMDLMRSLAESESRSRGLLSRVAELEGLIADERTKWHGQGGAGVPATPGGGGAGSSTLTAGGRPYL